MLIGRGPLVVAAVQGAILLVAMLASYSRRRPSEPDVHIDLTTPSVAGIPQQRNVRVIDLTDATIEELLNSDR